MKQGKQCHCHREAFWATKKFLSSFAVADLQQTFPEALSEFSWIPDGYVE
jgi:hypothetical protein